MEQTTETNKSNSIYKTICKMLEKKRFEGSKNIADIIEVLDNAYNPPVGFPLIDVDQYDKWRQKVYTEIQMPLTKNEKQQKAFVEMVKKELKVCKELGCRYNEDKTEMYNPDNNIRVKIADILKLNNQYEVRKALYKMKMN